MRISTMKADATDQQDLYKCTGATPADCMVDLSNAADLQRIEAAAQNVSLRVGEYTQIKLDTCAPGTSSLDMTSIQVKGTVQVGGTTFNTSSTAAGGMSNTGSSEFTTIPWGCGGALVKLRQPLKVTADSSQTLNLVVDLTNAVWTDANASPGMGGCKSDNGPGQDICASMALVVPYVSSTVDGGTSEAPPSFERYLVGHNSTLPAAIVLADANAGVNFAVNAGGEVFWVGVQPYFSEMSPTGLDPARVGPDYNTETRTMSKNSDGSIAFQTGGSPEDNRVGFTAFQRSTHTGTCKNETATQVWQYKAFKQ